MGIFSMLCTLFSCAQERNFKSVDVDEFEQIISNPEILRLDVRRLDEYQQGHLEGAINIDVLKDDFKEVALKNLNKSKTIALYCRSGNRSKKAGNILTAEGYEVIELKSGYMGWTSSNKPVVK